MAISSNSLLVLSSLLHPSQQHFPDCSQLPQLLPSASCWLTPPLIAAFKHHSSSSPKAKLFKIQLISTLSSDITTLVDSISNPTSKVPLTTHSLITHQILATELTSPSVFSRWALTLFLDGTFVWITTNRHQV